MTRPTGLRWRIQHVSSTPRTRRHPAIRSTLAVRGNTSAKSARLDALIQINLANVDRGFVPGNVRGQPSSNTPSLRGIWFQSNFLRHGHAHTLSEAVLAPGHRALASGEQGSRSTHSATSMFTA